MVSLNTLCIVIITQTNHLTNLHQTKGNKMRLFTQAIGIIMILTLAACTKEPAPEQIQGSTMGTYYQVSLTERTALTNAQIVELKEKIEEHLRDINQQMSTYISDSSISQFNQSDSTDWFPVPFELAQVTQNALLVSQQSNGAFDPTIYPLVKLWGFGDSFRRTVPSKSLLQQTSIDIGYQHLSVRLNPPALKKTKANLMLDLSAIAKGYAVDQLSQLLSEAGFENHMVDIGGEITTKGTNSKQQPWRIGIEKPHASNTTQRVAMQGVSLNNKSIATSGNYRNFFEQEGIRYSHTIDPSTGYPVEHTLASATVIHDSAEWADAYATALMVLGTKKGLAFAEKHKLAVYLISHNGSKLTTHQSSAFDAYLPQ